jgi:uncharacterized HAD superfamily protein
MRKGKYMSDIDLSGINNDVDNNINVGIDVDGTLTKEVVGRDILELSYSEVEKVMLSCTPQNGVDILLDDQLLGNNCIIYIITGRQEKYRCVTAEWLNTYGIPYDELVMFPNNFYRKNGYDIPKYVNLKVDLHIQRDISIAVDDNEKVIEGLNRSGISACQVTDNFKEAFKEACRL